MPDHVHLLVRSRKKDSKIERLLFGIKRLFSFRVKRNLVDHASPLLKQLMQQGRLGKSVFRFWQAGPGYDRNLNSSSGVVEAIEYIHFNPVKQKLCDSPDKWKWSSWSSYNGSDQQDDPDLPRVERFGR